MEDHTVPQCRDEATELCPRNVSFHFSWKYARDFKSYNLSLAVVPDLMIVYRFHATLSPRRRKGEIFNIISNIALIVRLLRVDKDLRSCQICLVIFYPSLASALVPPCRPDASVAQQSETSRN